MCMYIYDIYIYDMIYIYMIWYIYIYMIWYIYICIRYTYIYIYDIYIYIYIHDIWYIYIYVGYLYMHMIDHIQTKSSFRSKNRLHLAPFSRLFGLGAGSPTGCSHPMAAGLALVVSSLEPRNHGLLEFFEVEPIMKQGPEIPHKQSFFLFCEISSIEWWVVCCYVWFPDGICKISASIFNDDPYPDPRRNKHFFDLFRRRYRRYHCADS